MQSKTHQPQHAVEHEGAQTEGAEKDEETEEEQAQQGAQKRYLYTLLTPAQQAEVLFSRAGVELPEAVQAEVIGFEFEENGGFHCTLRRAVTVAGVTFEPFISGRLDAKRVEGLEGVRSGRDPVRRLETIPEGVRAAVRAHEGAVIPPRRPS